MDVTPPHAVQPYLAGSREHSMVLVVIVVFVYVLYVLVVCGLITPDRAQSTREPRGFPRAPFQE